MATPDILRLAPVGAPASRAAVGAPASAAATATTATATATATATGQDTFTRDAADPGALLGLQVRTAAGTLAALKVSGLLAARHRATLTILRNIAA